MLSRVYLSWTGGEVRLSIWISATSFGVWWRVVVKMEILTEEEPAFMERIVFDILGSLIWIDWSENSSRGSYGGVNIFLFQNACNIIPSRDSPTTRFTPVINMACMEWHDVYRAIFLS